MACVTDFSMCSLKRDKSVPSLDEDLRILGQRLIDGMRENGTVGLANTGFSFQQLKELHAVADKFFSLPESTKRKYIMRHETDQFRGYMAVGDEWVEFDRRDFKESLSLSAELKGMTDLEQEIPGFCASMRGVLTDYAALSERVLQCIALAEGLEKNVFKENCYGDISSKRDLEEVGQLKVVNYLPLNEQDDPKDYIRCSKHNDVGVVTLLVTDGVGGLQFKQPDGQWSDAEYGEHVVCLFAGTVLEVLLSGKVKAWEHRVIFKNDESRFKRRRGAIFFLNGKRDVMHRPLDGSDAYAPFSVYEKGREIFKSFNLSK